MLTLAACGGGGGGGSGGGSAPPSGQNPNGPTQVKLSGVAATGAAFAGATLNVIDQLGATVCATQTSPTGAYDCTLPASAKAPFVVIASRDDQILYSITASATGGTVNVTPLTTVIVSRLAPNGDPAALAAALKTQPDAVTDATVKQQVAALIAALKPLLAALGDTVDPISGSFSADGSGHDRVLDSIAVSVHPDGTAANIEITVKLVPSGSGDAPVSIIFRSSDATPPTLPQTITAQQLAPAGASLAVAALFERLTQCYALPLTQRVNAVNDSTAAVGGPADVIAPACRTLFVGDDPANFRNNGARVGRDAQNRGSFSGLFRPGATGVKFDRGVLEFYRPGGDLVLSYRNIDSTGAVQNLTVVARDVGGVLKLIGNQYDYGVNVTPTVQDREFLNSPAYNYVNLSYDIVIANQFDGNGDSIFDKALVTAPDGTVYTYAPSAGNAALVLVRPNGTPTGGSLLRVAASYRNASTAGNPAEKETGSYYLPQQLTDEQLRTTPEQAAWKVEFVFADTNKANVIQTHRLLARVPTMAEAKLKKFADLTPALRAELVAATASTGAIIFDAPSANEPSLVDFSAEGDLDAWTVPSDAAVVPVSLYVYGRSATGVQFDDRGDFAPAARKAKVFCSAASMADDHCTQINGNSLYALNTRADFFQLGGTDARQVQYLKGFATYSLNP